MKIKRLILLVVTTLLLASCGNQESKQPVLESKTETVEMVIPSSEPGSPESEMPVQSEEVETVVPESQEPSSEPESESQTEVVPEETEPVKESEEVKEPEETKGPETEETVSSEPGSPETEVLELEPEPETVVPESKEPEQSEEPAVHTHNYVLASETAASCVNDGVKTYQCSCGDAYLEILNRTGHNYVTDSKAATCSSNGYTKKYCTGCGHVESETVVNATGQHNYSSTVTTAATCKTEGVMTYSCSGCGSSYTESIPSSEAHYMVETERKQYCKEEGQVKYTCAYCGVTTTEPLPALGGEHTWVEGWFIAPTCHSGGDCHGQTCSKCGYYESLPESEPLGCVVEASGYTVLRVDHEGTCRAYEVLDYYCTRCGCTVNNEAEALGFPRHRYLSGGAHTWVADWEGIGGERCNYCGVYRSDVE